MWAADESHAPAVQFLVQHGADINAKSSPATRGGGPALGKAGDLESGSGAGSRSCCGTRAPI
jgi:hypothetical protein